jgi:hypothetical protein
MEILYRLIRDGKVVGEEKHENYGIVFNIMHRRIGEDTWYNIQCKDNEDAFIQHDRKDMWIGLEDKNGRKVFERDKFIINGEIFYVKWYKYDVAFRFHTDNKGAMGITAIHTVLEVIGIEGVEE